MKILLRGLVAIAFVSCFALAGCDTLPSVSSNQDIQKTPLQQAQDYVTSLDSRASEISKKADEYIEAIGKSDKVAAKLKFEEIATAFDDYANVEIPAVIKEEGEKYKQACVDLKDALSDLNEVANSKVAEEEMQVKVQEAQSKYDKVSANLRDADQSLKDKLDDLKNGTTSKPQA